MQSAKVSLLAKPNPDHCASLKGSVLTMPVCMTWLSWVAWRRDGLNYASWMVLGWILVLVATLLTASFTAAFVPYSGISHIVLIRRLLQWYQVDVLFLEETMLGERDDTPRVEGYAVLRRDRPATPPAASSASQGRATSPLGAVPSEWAERREAASSASTGRRAGSLFRSVLATT